MKNLLLNILRNPQTSVLGLLGIIASAKAVVAHPLTIGEPTFWATVSASVGLLLGKDGSTTGTAKTPEAGK